MLKTKKLDSGLTIFWKSKYQFLFIIFLDYLPYVLKFPRNLSFVRVVDCGATIGEFSLLIEHLRRRKILKWKKVQYVMVEPLKSVMSTLRRNASNLENCQVIWGAVGKKKGTVKFYPEKLLNRSSIFGKGDNFYKVPYIDLTGYLDEDTILKLDIEGAEFDFFKEYKLDLNIRALLVEWHFVKNGELDCPVELIEFPIYRKEG